MKTVASVLAVALLGLAGCATPGSGGLTPGTSTLADVEARLGRPAKTWKNADGSQQLAFPTGPEGTQTFMVFIAPDGKLQRIVGVLNEQFFGLIQPGMTQEQVLRLLGPAGGPATPYRRSDTFAWTWLYCQSQNVMQYFDVSFDATTGLVRGAGQHLYTRGYLPGTPPCTMQNIDLP
jgi:hypothetical protein